MFEPGSNFCGYTIQEKINEGGMATIYSATNSRGALVALRVLMLTGWPNRKSIQRFKRGCKILSTLTHPNVIRLHKIGRDHKLSYAVLEYINAPNLKERILKADKFLKANSTKLLLGIASGIAHVHERGFIHLDIKPENVLIPDFEEPKIIDFDIAIPRLKKPKRMRQLSGTPTYLAPEQVLESSVDERTDIFAFGLTAYELLTRKKPVTGNSIQELIQKYREFDKHLKPLRVHDPEIHPGIERVILKCLEKNVEHRYPSMTLVVRDLQK